MIVVIGAGPAGLFAAITARELAPDRPVVVCEMSGRALAKVLVSGGGRCNVTHACFDPKELVTRYPRGGRELRGPLTRFGPADTAAWFAARGVALKTEPDGRMFPVTDDARTVAAALLSAAHALGVELRLHQGVRAVRSADGVFTVDIVDGPALHADRVLLATGDARHSIGAHRPTASPARPRTAPATATRWLRRSATRSCHRCLRCSASTATLPG